MADFNAPLVTDTYANFLAYLKARDADLAVALSPTYSTPTNLPTGAQRWNPTNGYWEIRSAGGTWGALIAKYLIDVDKLDGQDGTYYLAWANFTGVPATFTPSTHIHDDRYYTETESDARFGSQLAISGNFLQIKTPGNVLLNQVTVPYATAAGDAATVGGFSVGQNLLPASSPTFSGAMFAGNVGVTNGVLSVGSFFYALEGLINLWDNVNSVMHGFRFSSSTQKLQVQDSAGAWKTIFSELNLPDWSNLTGVPTTFAPSAHGHVFDATSRLQVRSATSAALATITGLAGELIYDATNKDLTFHDATQAGGHRLVETTRSVATGTGLTGGGNLSADRTISVSMSSLAQAQAGTDTATVMNPARVKDAITQFTPTVATLSEAYAGAENTKIMTASRVKSQVDNRVANATEAMDVADALHLMTPQRVSQAISAQTVFSKKYVSSPQTITAAGLLTLAHGLGVAPALVEFFLVCQVAEIGFSPGDVVATHLSGTSAGGTRHSSAKLDSTNVSIRLCNSATVFLLADFATGAATLVTNANWKLIVGAYA